jgi:hypothetical protein
MEDWRAGRGASFAAGRYCETIFYIECGLPSKKKIILPKTASAGACLRGRRGRCEKVLFFVALIISMGLPQSLPPGRSSATRKKLGILQIKVEWEAPECDTVLTEAQIVAFGSPLSSSLPLHSM